MGLGLLASTIAISDGRPRTISTLAFSVSVSMFLSACTHSICGKILRPRNMRLRSSIGERMQSSPVCSSRRKAE